MNTQLVCETQPACQCINSDDPYSCDCIAGVGANPSCKHCGEQMVLIDTDTGDIMRNGVITTCH